MSVDVAGLARRCGREGFDLALSGGRAVLRPRVRGNRPTAGLLAELAANREAVRGFLEAGRRQAGGGRWRFWWMPADPWDLRGPEVLLCEKRLHGDAAAALAGALAAEAAAGDWVRAERLEGGAWEWADQVRGTREGPCGSGRWWECPVCGPVRRATRPKGASR